MGSCAEYLYLTVKHLEERGIRDRNLWQLQKLVACEIRVIHKLDGAKPEHPVSARIPSGQDTGMCDH
jgi:cation transport protein ChaC